MFGPECSPTRAGVPDAPLRPGLSCARSPTASRREPWISLMQHPRRNHAAFKNTDGVNSRRLPLSQGSYRSIEQRHDTVSHCNYAACKLCHWGTMEVSRPGTRQHLANCGDLQVGGRSRELRIDCRIDYSVPTGSQSCAARMAHPFDDLCWTCASKHGKRSGRRLRINAVSCCSNGYLPAGRRRTRVHR